MPRGFVEPQLRPSPSVRRDVTAAPPEDVVPPRRDRVVDGGMAALYGGLGTREQIQDELDGMAGAMRNFYLRSPDQVLRECSAYGARLTEMIVLLHRVEHTDRTLTRIRTMQCQRFLDELDKQFKIHSRLIEIARQDLAMAGGFT